MLAFCANIMKQQNELEKDKEERNLQTRVEGTHSSQNGCHFLTMVKAPGNVVSLLCYLQPMILISVDRADWNGTERDPINF